jgi:membrane protein implicated in regulation of membrane protease activity
MSETSGKPGQQLETDGRSWLALALLGVIAGATTYRWHMAGWFWLAIVVLALLRSAAFVLGARALGRDPEDELQRERHGHNANAPIPRAP